jgi:GAF domain-containing protein
MQLLPTLSQAIGEAPDFTSAVCIALDQVCTFTSWDYGEAWIPNLAGTVLKLSPAWYRGTQRGNTYVLAIEQFRLCSEKLIVSPGMGLPGRVWLTEQPEWICDVSLESESYFWRHYLAKAFGIKAGLAVPILANGRVIAVLVFFMLDARKEDRRLVELISSWLSQLGEMLDSYQLSAIASN